VEISEIEPNEGPTNASAFKEPYYASIDPAGDIDVVSFVLSDVKTSVIARIIDVGDGSCPAWKKDSFLEILGPDGATVLSSDDDGGEGYCSRVVLPSLAAGTYYARVKAGPRAAVPTFTYRLRVVLFQDVCGDGIVTPGEACDDGNVAANDGCSPACTIEISEIEPNNTPAQANVFSAPWNAVLTPIGDADVVAVDVTTGGATLSVTTTDQGTGACAAKTLDTKVDILAPNGTTVIASGDDEIGNCAFASAPGLVAGTYYVRVSGGSLVSDPAPYGLTITVQ